MQTSDASANLLRAEAELVLTEARRIKAEKTKTLGSPIQLAGIALAIVIRDGDAWIGENTAVARKLQLETGRTMQIYRGHSGPVTALAFSDKVDPGDGKILITGSWDMTIKIWDTETKEQINSVDAHTDFVKCLFAYPSLKLLVSGSSDKSIRFWELPMGTNSRPMTSRGSITAHTRPIECLVGVAEPNGTALLYSADTMGVVKVWALQKDGGAEYRWESVLVRQVERHRTRINQMLLGNGELWTASTDETVQVTPEPPTAAPPPPPITHPTAVRAILPLSLTHLGEPYLIVGAGDVIRSYDVSDLAEPELLSEIDAHWHDVTALRLWLRRWQGEDGKIRVEPWIVSASLDGTLRKWKLSELLKRQPTPPKPVEPLGQASAFQLSEEEERALAELDSD